MEATKQEMIDLYHSALKKILMRCVMYKTVHLKQNTIHLIEPFLNSNIERKCIDLKIKQPLIKCTQY